jgi:hypothetical protein
MRIDDSRGEEKIRGGRLSSFLFNPKAKPLFNHSEASNYSIQEMKDYTK